MSVLSPGIGLLMAEDNRFYLPPSILKMTGSGADNFSPANRSSLRIRLALDHGYAMTER